jgi:hypothetical protein
MKAYTYKNTKTIIPNWETTTHLSQIYGYGYETDSHFVHFYGKKNFYIISVGLTVIESKNGTYLDWIDKRFGATDIEEMILAPGETIDSIWRPALYFFDDLKSGIKISEKEQRSQEQALRILIEKLDELLLFIEPSSDGLKAYSHKIRELLILACTEVENQWRSLLEKANWSPVNGRIFTTVDYVKILPVSHLIEYEIGLKNIDTFVPSKPFSSWTQSSPTQSLPWYDAYNKTKHNRDSNFQLSQFQYAIDAVAANIILYCTRFSPLLLLNDTHTLSGLIKQIFEIKMIDADRKTFYLPNLKFQADTRRDCFVFDSQKAGFQKSWNVNNLIL